MQFKSIFRLLYEIQQIPIEIDSDFVITAGEDTEKYKQKLYGADIVLALISADFINNDDIYMRNKR